MQFDNLVFVPDNLSHRSRPRTPSSTMGTRISGSVSSIDGHVQYAGIRQPSTNSNEIIHIRQMSNQEHMTYPFPGLERPDSSMSAPADHLHHHKLSPGIKRMTKSDLLAKRSPNLRTSPANFQRQFLDNRARSRSVPQPYFPSSERDESHYTLPNDVKLEMATFRRRLGVSDDTEDVPAGMCLPDSNVHENYLEPTMENHPSHGSPVLYNPESKITYLTSKDLENIVDEEEDAESCARVSGTNLNSEALTMSSNDKLNEGPGLSPPGSGGVVSPSDREVMAINFPEKQTDVVVNNSLERKNKYQTQENYVFTEKACAMKNGKDIMRSDVPDIIKQHDNYNDNIIETGEVIMI